MRGFEAVQTLISVITNGAKSKSVTDKVFEENLRKDKNKLTNR